VSSNKNCGKHTKTHNINAMRIKISDNINSRVLKTNTSITTLGDQNHLLLGDSSNDAHGKMWHPLEAT
jgi:hypothetical protein